jgi:hypothetical protein
MHVKSYSLMLLPFVYVPDANRDIVIRRTAVGTFQMLFVRKFQGFSSSSLITPQYYEEYRVIRVANLTLANEYLLLLNTNFWLSDSLVISESYSKKFLTFGKTIYV